MPRISYSYTLYSKKYEVIADLKKAEVKIAETIKEIKRRKHQIAILRTHDTIKNNKIRGAEVMNILRYKRNDNNMKKMIRNNIKEAVLTMEEMVVDYNCCIYRLKAECTRLNYYIKNWKPKYFDKETFHIGKTF